MASTARSEVTDHTVATSSPSMAELVDELEADGLLERRPDPSDGRAKLVVLTPAGWDAIPRPRHHRRD